MDSMATILLNSMMKLLDHIRKSQEKQLTWIVKTLRCSQLLLKHPEVFGELLLPTLP